MIFTRDSRQTRLVDQALERLGTRGVSRREFIDLISAGAVIAGSGLALSACTSDKAGSPGTKPTQAVTSKSGKLAFLVMTNELQYDVQMDHATEAVAKQLGYTYASFNGQGNAQTQLNQYQQSASSGFKGIVIHSPDGSNIRSITSDAQSQQIYVGNVWGTQAWLTPWDVGKYWTLYGQPDEFLVQGEVVAALCKALNGEGNIVRVTGVKGNSADIIRTAGANAALKKFPKVKLLGELPGNWTPGDSQTAMQNLLARYPNIQGVIAQNDDEATGVVAAIKAAGKTPGKDILVVGADGTDEAAKRIAAGEQLATTANVPGYAGYLMATRIYDVMHGWEPNDGERMMRWKSIILTKENIDPYLKRYVGTPADTWFNAKLMSHVMHPDDWDPQFLLYPSDLDDLFVDIPKPSGYKYPEAYTHAKDSGLFDKVAAEYKEHYKHDVLDPVAE